MKTSWLLPPISVAITLLVALAIIRWYAPQLLGIPIELQMVRVSDKVPPFFDGVFRPDDHASPEFFIKDPYLLRAKPLYPDRGLKGGPHDILGFRNRCVPHAADVITIGDSQTYGNGTRLDGNWPSHLGRELAGRAPTDPPAGRAPTDAHIDAHTIPPTVYNMSVAGWGPVHLLEVFPKSLYFRPRAVIVAFYTGNDPLEAFELAYGAERWASLRPDPQLGAGDIPGVRFPAPRSEWWPVVFADSTQTVFTPELRRASNQDHPAVHAGYAIMGAVAERIGAAARADSVPVVFTIIPTKELVFARKVERDGLDPPESYRSLVTTERRNLERLAAHLATIAGAAYVDLVAPMQEAALGRTRLYPRTTDGHPSPRGHQVIARTLAAHVGPLLDAAARPTGS